MKDLYIFKLFLLKFKVALGIIFLFIVSFANAATITSKTTGNWSSASTWTPISRTGTISVTSGTKAVTGVGTSFTTELAVGSVLYRSNGTTLIGTVASITDDTHLTLVSNATSTVTSIAYTAAVVPTASDDVIIASGTTVSLVANEAESAKSISVDGTLNTTNGSQITDYGNFTVSSTGTFSMGSGSDVGTLLVYNDFLNNGSTNFWKSNVIIAGNFTTTTTALQNNGNIVIGGDITGNFNLTGGTGANQIYAVNPNATVTITPTSVDNNVPPGTYPSGESAALQALVNTVVYGGSCSFTVNNIANVTACTGSNVVFSVSTNATSPTYQWQVNKNDGTGWNDLTNVTPYSTVTSSSLNISNITAGMNNYQYRAKITASSCTMSGNPGKLLTVTGSGSWIGGTSTDWNTASNWCGGIPTATTDVVIPSGTAFSPTIAAGTTALCNNLTINASATLTMAGSSTSLLNISGDFTNNGTFTAGAGSTVNYAGAAQSVAGVTYSNLTTSGSGDKTLSGAITVNNNLYIGTGTRLIDNENQITGNATGTLTVENNATLFLGRIAVNGTISTLFPTNFTKANIDLQTGSTVQYNSWVAQTISYVPNYYSIECQYPGTKSTSGAGTLTINGNLGTASVLNLSSCTAVNLSGDFNLWGAGATVTLPNGTFSIKGDFNRDVINSGGAITPGTGTVVFNGTAAQTMTGNGSNSFSFYNLTINNTSGGVGLSTTTTGGTNDDVIVTNTLTLTNGVLTTSSTNLLNVTNTAVGAISGGSSTSYISGPVKWTMSTSAATYAFPVGKGGNYLPFTLINTTGPTSSPTAQVEAFTTNSGGTANFSTIGSLSTTEYWSLVTTGTFSNTKVSLTRPTAISPFDAIAGSTTVNGTYSSLAGTVGTYGITTSSSIGTNRFFVFGSKSGIHTSSISSPFCPGSSVSVPYTIATSSTFTANTFTAQLSDASGSFTSPVSIGTLTSNAAGTIPATIPGGTASGTGYRIRVVSSNPAIVGSDNGANLTVNPILTPSVSIAATATTVCAATSVTFTATPTNGGAGPTYQWKKNGTNVGTGTNTYTNAAWVNNDVITCVLTSNYSCLTTTTATSNSITMTVGSGGGSWSGATSTNWNTNSNWCSNSVPVAATNVVLNGGVLNNPTISVAAVCNNLTINSGSTLTVSSTTLNMGGNLVINSGGTLVISGGVVTVNGSITINSGGTLTVTSPGALSAKGDIINAGTLSGTGTTTLNGTISQNISGTGSFGNITLNNSSGCTASSAVTVTGILTLTSGQLTSNGNLTVDLNTGAINGSGTGTILGNITTSKTISSSKYHMVASPLSGLTAASWNDNIAISSGNYANFYSYDETNTDTAKTTGWTQQTSATALTSLQGFALYFTGATTLDQTGAYTHSATYTNSTLTNTVSLVGGTYNPSADGWNLLGNPYPSAIDWSIAGGWTKTGLDNAIYCWDAANSRYTSFVAGIGTNGGTQYIPSMQGFWVKVSSPGTGSITVNNNARVTTTNPAIWRTASVADILKLTASSAGYTDETIIRFRDDALNTFDTELDAYKLDNEDNTPSLYTELNHEQYSVNSLQTNSGIVSIPVKLSAAFTGNYTFTAQEVAGFNSGDSIIFEDRHLGIKQDLRTKPAYTCSVTQRDTSARFYISFRKGNVSGLNLNPSTPSSMIINSVDGKINIQFLNESSNTASIEIYNTIGNPVFKVENADISSKAYSIQSLNVSNGIYIVKVITDSQISTRKVYLIK